eukprot:TRINITY_DN1296_c0_g2_i1.p1 TRINITY_DN1296_c0_g2~~TRINITY_DN1296_c0_g2_i1.p1  ORF type:complete len:1003 (+),score=180.96 TRINITY_DN1296_c0_g2_i1:37-3009(+)
MSRSSHSSYSSSIARSGHIPITSITKPVRSREGRRRSSSTSSRESVDSFKKRRSSATIPPSQSPSRQRTHHHVDPSDHHHKRSTKQLPPSQSPHRGHGHDRSDVVSHGTQYVVPVNITVDTGPEAHYHHLQKCGKEATCAFKDIVEEEVLSVLPPHDDERYLKYIDVEKKKFIRLVFHFECRNESDARRTSDILRQAVPNLSIKYLQYGAKAMTQYTKKQTTCKIYHSDCWVSNYRKGGGREDRPRHEIYMVIDEDHSSFNSDLFVVALCKHLRCDKKRVQMREHKRNRENTAATISVTGHNARLICGELCSQANDSKSSIHNRLVRFLSCDYYRDYAESEDDSSCSSATSSSSSSYSDSESDVDAPSPVPVQRSPEEDLNYSGVHDLAKVGPGGTSKGKEQSIRRNYQASRPTPIVNRDTTYRTPSSPVRKVHSPIATTSKREQQSHLYNKPVEMVPPAPPAEVQSPVALESSHRYVKSMDPQPATMKPAAVGLFQPEQISTSSSSEKVKKYKKGKEHHKSSSSSSSSTSERNATQTPGKGWGGDAFGSGIAASQPVQGSAKTAVPKGLKREDSSESFKIPSNPAPHPNAPGLSLPKVPPPPGEIQQYPSKVTPTAPRAIGREVSVTSDPRSSSSSSSSSSDHVMFKVKNASPIKKNKDVPTIPIRSAHNIGESASPGKHVPYFDDVPKNMKKDPSFRLADSRSDALTPREKNVNRQSSKLGGSTPRDGRHLGGAPVLHDVPHQKLKKDPTFRMADSRSDAPTPREREIVRQGSRYSDSTKEPNNIPRLGDVSNLKDVTRQNSRLSDSRRLSDVPTPRTPGRDMARQGSRLGEQTPRDMARQGSRLGDQTPRDVTRQGSRLGDQTPRDMGRRSSSRLGDHTPRDMTRQGSHLSATGNNLDMPTRGRANSRGPLLTPRERSRSTSRDPFAYDNRDVEGGGRLRTNQKAVSDCNKTFGRAAREAQKNEGNAVKKTKKIVKKKSGVLGILGF